MKTRIDRRTGKIFPSVTRTDTRQGLEALGHGASAVASRLRTDERTAENDSTWDFIVGLDPHTLVGMGIGFIYDPNGPEDNDSDDRPVEWFHEVAKRVSPLLAADDRIWEIVNEHLDRAVFEVDIELRFSES